MLSSFCNGNEAARPAPPPPRFARYASSSGPPPPLRGGGKKSRSRDACASEFCRSQIHEKPFARKATRVPSGAPGGAGVVGHATRTDVATHPRFGRGARHRTIRLREPPASGALRLPALHHHRRSPPPLASAAA